MMATYYICIYIYTAAYSSLMMPYAALHFRTFQNITLLTLTVSGPTFQPVAHSWVWVVSQLGSLVFQNVWLPNHCCFPMKSHSGFEIAQRTNDMFIDIFQMG